MLVQIAVTQEEKWKLLMVFLRVDYNTVWHIHTDKAELL